MKCERCTRPVTGRRFRCATCDRLCCHRCTTNLHRASTCTDCQRTADDTHRRTALTAKYRAGWTADRAAAWWGANRDATRALWRELSEASSS